MTDLDQMIDDALAAEDRALLEKFSEQGLIAQVRGLFAGRLGWWFALTSLVQTALFAGAVFAAFKFLGAGETAAMLRWGGVFGLLMAAMSVIKLMHFMQMQTNQVLREVKRVELQLVRLRADKS